MSDPDCGRSCSLLMVLNVEHFVLWMIASLFDTKLLGRNKKRLSNGPLSDYCMINRFAMRLFHVLPCVRKCCRYFSFSQENEIIL